MTSPKLQQGWLRAIVLLILYLVTSVIFEVLYIKIIYTFSLEAKMNSWVYYKEIIKRPENYLILLFSQVFQVIGLLTVSLIFYKWIDRQSISQLFRELRWNSRLFAKGSLLGILLITILFLMLGGFYSEKISFQSFDSISIVVYISLFFLVSVNEEVFTRGMILANLDHSFSKLLSLIISSLFFTSLHLFNEGITLLGFVNIFLAGLLLGIVYFRTKNLWIAIGLHFTWNLFQGVVYGFEVSGTKVKSILKLNFEEADIINGGIFGLEGSILTTVLTAIVCGYYLSLDKRIYFSH